MSDLIQRAIWPSYLAGAIRGQPMYGGGGQKRRGDGLSPADHGHAFLRAFYAHPFFVRGGHAPIGRTGYHHRKRGGILLGFQRGNAGGYYPHSERVRGYHRDPTL